MSLFHALGASASALGAERLRMELISENLSNVQTTRTPSGEPYRRKMVAFSERDQGFRRVMAAFLGGRFMPVNESAAGGGDRGVRAVGIFEDSRPFKRTYTPGHPDADQDGYVLMPNVDVVEEMVNLMAASRTYEANVTAFNVTRSMIESALAIGRGG